MHTVPSRSVYIGSSTRQRCAVQTAGARIRVVRNPLFYGCRIRQPFLILDTVRQGDPRPWYMLGSYQTCLGQLVPELAPLSEDAIEQGDRHNCVFLHLAIAILGAFLNDRDLGCA